MHFLLIFAATFIVVFALGFQSLTVNRGHYMLAFFNSFLISAANLAILKFVPESSGVLDYIAYMTGGPLGIVTSMWVFQKLLPRLERLSLQGTGK
ncbi:hypothetical protein [Methylovorus glucosotrophus]|uniref:Uncharacterized protein n=1 Tax=Methylovorus glucosotrophus (strain SIP3-4) TaxID=582744 RepID=C6XEN4_METGS|nr:hypothetical protein [Methylovorus glucosotrophus]ACT52091.1 hypothetical protein Msip34_2867 [Methylovorus glucosotrophus SIP3-4]